MHSEISLLSKIQKDYSAMPNFNVRAVYQLSLNLQQLQNSWLPHLGMFVFIHCVPTKPATKKLVRIEYTTNIQIMMGGFRFSIVSKGTSCQISFLIASREMEVAFSIIRSTATIVIIYCTNVRCNMSWRQHDHNLFPLTKYTRE